MALLLANLLEPLTLLIKVLFQPARVLLLHLQRQDATSVCISFGVRETEDEGAAYLHRFLRVVAFGDGYVVLVLSLVEGESSMVLLFDSLVERMSSAIYSLQIWNERSSVQEHCGVVIGK